MFHSGSDVQRIETIEPERGIHTTGPEDRDGEVPRVSCEELEGSWSR